MAASRRIMVDDLAIRALKLPSRCVSAIRPRWPWPIKNDVRSKDACDASAMPSAPKDTASDVCSEDEAAILRRQTAVTARNVGYFHLYRFATRTDALVLLLACLCSVASGVAMPLMTVVFGRLARSFNNLVQDRAPSDAFSHEVDLLALYMVYLAVGQFFASYISTTGHIYIGERISRRIRDMYLTSTLRQNIAFFDDHGAGEMATRITADAKVIQEGLSEKVGLVITALATLISAYVIGLVECWRLALILISTFVAVFCTSKLLVPGVVRNTITSFAAVAEGGGIAEEAISSIRDITMLGSGAQDRVVEQYSASLDVAEKAGFKAKAILNLLIALILCYVYLTYALAFWQGSRYLVAGQASISEIITTLLAIMIGAFALNGVAGEAQAFTAATAAASRIFATIDRQSPLDPDSDEGMTIPSEEMRGALELRSIRLVYPSRPGVPALDRLNLYIPGGKVTAIVGASGCGKSSIIGLVERFYCPTAGEILLDGYDISSLNLRWLRQQLGLVSPEMTLFSSTIFDNISMGLVGTVHEYKSITEKRQLVEDAAKTAGIHDFISSQLPDAYQTIVGEHGSRLSGGQKQRVMIARAIIRNPAVLLLDEATSALDVKTEATLQTALATARKERTTIVIAHRLSTIKAADNIVVLGSGGQILEQGTHKNLLKAQGPYYKLVQVQKIANNLDPNAVSIPEDYAEKDTNGNLHDSRGGGQDGEVAVKEKLPQTPTIEEPAPQSPKVTHSLWDHTLYVASLGRQEWRWMLSGLACAVISGSCNPINAIFFAEAITTLTLPSDRYSRLRSQADFWSWMYFVIAIAQLLSRTAYGVSLSYCSERLVRRVREQAFRVIMKQDVAFFDEASNSAGSLTSFLGVETNNVAGLSGLTLGILLEAIATVVVAFLIGISFGWKLTLVCTATVPVILACGFLRFWMYVHFGALSVTTHAASASYACETTSAIRTIAAFSGEEGVRAKHRDLLQQYGVKFVRLSLRGSLVYAASQSLLFLCIAFGFWYGSRLVIAGEYDMFRFYVCYTAIVFGAQSAGAVFSWVPNVSQARNAASRLRELLHSAPEIEAWRTAGSRIPNGIIGSLEFRHVWFSYATRPERPILTGLNLAVSAGQHVALVSPSGAGKSTALAILARFYDPATSSAGGVYIDGEDIRNLHLESYRKHLAYVAQQTTMYRGTIRDNVTFGLDRLLVDDGAIERACRSANIYDFVVSLPDGFQTTVGSNGALLSAGQRQRVAIARAILREPKILLLDETTSALDTENERIVQASIESAAVVGGRTTISVAHRLNTIVNVDTIYFVEHGRVVEAGTHEELMQKKGRYYELACLQSLTSDEHS